jgi:hypothetical protein
MSARSTVVFGSAPFGLNPTVKKETLERRIQRAFADLEDLVGYILQMGGNAISVHRTSTKGFEDEQVERAGEKVAGLVFYSHRLARGVWMF